MINVTTKSVQSPSNTILIDGSCKHCGSTVWVFSYRLSKTFDVLRMIRGEIQQEVTHQEFRCRACNRKANRITEAILRRTGKFTTK